MNDNQFDELVRLIEAIVDEKIACSQRSASDTWYPTGAERVKDEVRKALVTL